MVREEAEREEDSGWSFMAGNEDDEFIEDYKNIKLLSIAEMCQMAPEIQEHIDKLVGTALIRNILQLMKHCMTLLWSAWKTMKMNVKFIFLHRKNLQTH